MTSTQAEFVERAFARAKSEILADIASGVLPKSIGDYDELCRYVIQPGDYGGLNKEETEAQGAVLFPPPSPLSGSHVGYVRARLEPRLASLTNGSPGKSVDRKRI